MKRIKKAIVVAMVTACCLLLCTAAACGLIRVKGLDLTLPIIISLSAAAALFFLPALAVLVVIEIRKCAESHNFVEVRPVPGPQTSKAGEEATTPDMMDIYDEVCDPTEPSKEVIYDNPIGVMSGEDGEAKIMEITPNPAYGTVFTKNERVLTVESAPQVVDINYPAVTDWLQTS